MATKRKGRNRGQITQTGPGKYQLRVYLGEDHRTGKRITKSKTYRGTKAAAHKALTAMLAALDAQPHVMPNRATVTKFWHDFLDSKQKISERTRSSYSERFDKDIQPFLGKYELKDVTPQLMQRWIKWMDTERGLSPRTIQYSKGIAFQMFSLAVRWHMIPTNPALGVEVPKQNPGTTEVLTPAESNRLLAAASSDPLGALWWLLLGSGLRPQEALALTWTDFDGSILSVNKALTQDRTGWIVGPTKTRKSRRTVTLPDACAEVLKEYQRSTGGIAGALMFSTATGGFLDISNVRRYWKRACKRADVPIVKLHAARHTHATALLQGKVPLKVVSERLGHSNVGTTGDIYSHVLPEMDAQAAAVMDSMLQRKAQ